MGSGENSTTSAVVQRLNQAAQEQLEKGNYDKALEHYVSAVEESERNDDHDTNYTCLLNAGACMVSLRRCKEGLQLLERAIDIVHTLGKELDKEAAAIHADVYFNAGIAAQELKDFSKAVSYFRSSLELYLNYNHKEYASEACSNLAKCYRHLGERDKEIDAWIGSQKLHHDLGDCDGEALAYGELVVAYLLGNKITECRQALCTAKMMCLRSTNPKTQGQLYAQFGLVYTALGLYEEALASFERALPLVKSNNQSQQLEGTILQNMGVVYNEKGLYADAIVYHTEASTIHGQLENYQAQVKCLCNLGVAHAKLKDFNKAIETFGSALERATLIEDYILQLQALESTGSVYYQMKRFSKAKENYHNALGVLRHIKYDTGLARERIMEEISNVVEAEQQQMITFQNALADSVGSHHDKRTLQRDQSMSDPTRPTSAMDHPTYLLSPITADRSKSLSSGGIDSTGLRVARPNLPNVVENSHDSPDGSSVRNVSSHIRPAQVPAYVERKRQLPPLTAPQTLAPPRVITVADGNTKSVQSHLELQQTIRSLQYGTSTDGNSLTKTNSTGCTPGSHSARNTPAFAKSTFTPPSTAPTRHSTAKQMPTSSSRLEAYTEDYEQQLLNDYMRTYDDNYKVFSTDSDEQLDSDSGNDELGASIFSRHASRQNRNSSKQRTSVRPPRTPYRRKLLTPRVPQVVQEGSLAISPIARQEYETRKNKNAAAKNIVRINSSGSDQHRTTTSPATTSSPATSRSSSQQSRLCSIL